MGHASFQLDRRAFLKSGLLAAGALALGPGFLRRAFASGPVTVGTGPYGPVGPYDANGIALPAGFSSREIARGGSAVPGSGYQWHAATDGQATFATRAPGTGPDGGWILVANSEVRTPGAGGASAVEFSADGGVERAYRALEGTAANCAGGPTPWGTWLSCEEHPEGRVWECDPTGAIPGAPRPALGVFTHEAACVDPAAGRLYMTEDEPDGCLYRFTPTAYPDLSAGLLEVAVSGESGTLAWAEVPDPAGGAANPARNQVAGAARFSGGEGLWHDQGAVYFTTKGDNRVWAYHVADSRLEVLYDAAAAGPDAPLSGVDNITVSPSGDVFVCEDGADHDICMVTPGFEISRFLRLDRKLHAGPPGAGNETVGVVFDPSGERMYFGVQRSFPAGGEGAGAVYEVSGPFRQAPAPQARVGGRPGDGIPAPDGLVGAGVRLGVRRRHRIRGFLRWGLPIALELDEPTGIDALLRVRGGNGRGPVEIAAVSPSVALRDAVVLRLAPGARARRLLRGTDRVHAELTVSATGKSGVPSTARRKLLLHR